MNDTAILLITCPDRKGLVARVSTLLYQRGANILHADQHQDHEAGLFFMRVEWTLNGFDVEAFRAEFAAVAAELQMVSVRNAVHIVATDFLALWRQGRSFDEFPHLAEAAAQMLEDLAWWTKALKTARANPS